MLCWRRRTQRESYGVLHDGPGQNRVRGPHRGLRSGLAVRLALWSLSRVSRPGDDAGVADVGHASSVAEIPLFLISSHHSISGITRAECLIMSRREPRKGPLAILPMPVAAWLTDALSRLKSGRLLVLATCCWVAQPSISGATHAGRFGCHRSGGRCPVACIRQASLDEAVATTSQGRMAMLLSFRLAGSGGERPDPPPSPIGYSPPLWGHGKPCLYAYRSKCRFQRCWGPILRLRSYER